MIGNLFLFSRQRVIPFSTFTNREWGSIGNNYVKALLALGFQGHVGTIGAVFDFFAGTVERAPMWWQRHGLEWLYRLLKEQKRMWRRYIIGNALFLFNVVFRERW